MSKQKKEKRELSVDEEMMMWCAYRYAIGRHTYVNDLAYYIASHYYDRLSAERRQHSADDIRDCIATQLSFGTCCELKYEGNVSRDERKPLEDLLDFFEKNQIDSEEKILAIKEVRIYHDSYKKGEEHKYNVTYQDSCKGFFSGMNINDLIPWMELASLFDKESHKIVHTKINDVEEDIECIVSYHNKLEELPDQPGYCRCINCQWEKIYIPVKDALKNSPNRSYINNQYIVSVSPLNAVDLEHN